MQINARLGLAFPELQPHELPPPPLELLELLWRDGRVEAICPTLVTCAVEPLMRQALALLGAKARAQHRPGRCLLGLGAPPGSGPFLATAAAAPTPKQHLLPAQPGGASSSGSGGF